MYGGNLHKGLFSLQGKRADSFERAQQKSIDSHERCLTRIAKHAGLHRFINHEAVYCDAKRPLVNTILYTTAHAIARCTPDVFLTTHSPSRLSGNNAL